MSTGDRKAWRASCDGFALDKDRVVFIVVDPFHFDDGFTPNDLIDLAGRVEAHLAMTFHRLIDGPQPQFRLRLNGGAVNPWDPFMMGHPGKALESMEYRILHTTGVAVQCHVLPHRDMLKPVEQVTAAGSGGWTQQEGFYVYRNRRLLVSGGWLGLGDGGKPWPRDEAHRLARIRLDIPNSADAEWKINILKSTASPPVRLRPQLHRIASETRDTARRVFAHRGHVSPASGGRSNALAETWQVRRSAQGTTYRIARDHDLVASILSRAGPLKADTRQGKWWSGSDTLPTLQKSCAKSSTIWSRLARLPSSSGSA